MKGDTTYAQREAATEAQRRSADAAHAALCTPEGLRACFPSDSKAHGYRYPNARRAARERANLPRSDRR